MELIYRILCPNDGQISLSVLVEICGSQVTGPESHSRCYWCLKCAVPIAEENDDIPVRYVGEYGRVSCRDIWLSISIEVSDSKVQSASRRGRKYRIFESAVPIAEQNTYVSTS